MGIVRTRLLISAALLLVLGLALVVASRPGADAHTGTCAPPLPALASERAEGDGDQAKSALDAPLGVHSRAAVSVTSESQVAGSSHTFEGSVYGQVHLAGGPQPLRSPVWVRCKPSTYSLVGAFTDDEGNYEIRNIPLGPAEVMCDVDSWYCAPVVASPTKAQPRTRVDLDFLPVRSLEVFVRDTRGHVLDVREPPDSALLSRFDLAFTCVAPQVGEDVRALRRILPIELKRDASDPSSPCWHVKTSVSPDLHACLTTHWIAMDAVQVRPDQPQVQLTLTDTAIRSQFGDADLRVVDADTGRPIDDVRVEVVGIDLYGARRTTDGDGRVHLEMLPIGDVEMRFTDAQHLPGSVSTIVKAGETVGIEASMMHGVSISGTLLDASGSPTSGRILCRPQDLAARGHPSKMPSIMFTMGEFSLGPLRPGIYVLDVQGPDAPWIDAETTAASAITVDVHAGSVANVVLRLW